ncbi:MAG TPA: ABC transporter ATP-binding protein [Anaerolineae bacterium]|nr:ABC transporter ATP-binding protein [Anaerolineae bacterium]
MNVSLKSYWALLSDHIKPQKARFALLAILLLGNIGLQLINPQIVRHFIDAAQSGASVENLLYAALAFIAIALTQQVIAVSATYTGENVAWTATNTLRVALLRRCLDLDMRFHNEKTPGELIERIDGDVSQIAAFFSRFVIIILGNALLLLGILVVLAFEDWRLGLAFAFFSALTLWALNRVRDLAVPDQKARRQASAELFGFIEEQLNGAEDIRSSGAVSFVLRELSRLQTVILRHAYRASQKEWLMGLTGSSLLTLVNITVMVAGYALYRDGAMTIGTVYLLISYAKLLAQPIWELYHQIREFQAIGAGVERLRDLQRVPREIEDGPGADIAEGALALAFDAVDFAYVADEPVLRDVSFRLEPGKAMGVLGRTGSGKTTLARLVFRLYDPGAGAIRLGDVDVRAPTLETLRRRVGMVTQDVQLFQASVRDNLTFFDSTIPDARIHAVIADLELSDWYAALPDGLDTEIEAGGRSLSAGEAQLLAFARVFLRDPGLVILDEASSRLDPATEQRIERAVDKLLRDRTALIIAHRLGTIHRADDVLILERGRILEYGNRAQLAAAPDSHLHHLLQTGLEEVLA